MQMHPFRLLKNGSAEHRTGGMPHIPLVLFRVDDPECVLCRATALASRNAGFLFSGGGRQVACFWGHAHLVMGHVHRSLLMECASGDLRPFGCIPPDGFEHPGTPNMNPLGMGVKLEGGTRRVFGATGETYLSDVCRHLFRAGLECPGLKDMILRLAASNMSGIEYRRAEEELTLI